MDSQVCSFGQESLKNGQVHLLDEALFLTSNCTVVFKFHIVDLADDLADARRRQGIMRFKPRQ
jgi:hypothetical protein